MAVSTLRSIVMGSTFRASKPSVVTIPMLTESAASLRPSTRIGSSTASRICSAISVASSMVCKPSHTTTNSSPPVRATVSA